LPSNRVVLIHGYSDQGKSFDTWAGKLKDRGVDAEQINICNYISLNNEITIPDIAEGLHRAILDLGWQKGEPYDAIVHSTGMLVIRAYLCNDATRPQDLKHLIGLAPATWGSPLASQGRSFLGMLFKGNHQLGPDFLNSGNLILDGLELGSQFTWDLAHRDLLSDKPVFTTSDDSPYVAVFIGNTPYTGIRELINQPATDGTVRWAGCALNTRKFVVDLRRNVPDGQRMTILDWRPGRLSIPMFAVDGKTHGTILTDPADDLADQVVGFLKIASEADFDAWLAAAKTWHEPALAKMKVDNEGPHDGWQQFVFHVVDEYNRPVPDYVVDLFAGDPTGLEGSALSAIELTAFDLDVHAYTKDKSFRCFHARLPHEVTTNGAGKLWLRLTASSGTELIAYQGYGSANSILTEVSPVLLDISQFANGTDTIFRPFTTTLVEIRVTREPLPFTGQSQLMKMQRFSSQN
jgi:hypothetical protein